MRGEGAREGDKNAGVALKTPDKTPHTSYEPTNQKVLEVEYFTCIQTFRSCRIRIPQGYLHAHACQLHVHTKLEHAMPITPAR